MFSLPQEKISVIVPVYNEGEKIFNNLKILENSLKGLNYEIIVVSDGSSDNSQDELRKYQVLNNNLKFYHYSFNQGKGFALRFGFSKSSGKYIVFIDGDLELSPDDIKNFYGLLKVYQADIVIGSKRHPQSQINYPFHRRLLSFTYQNFVRLL